jgi:hypothetical protein
MKAFGDKASGAGAIKSDHVKRAIFSTTIIACNSLPKPQALLCRADGGLLPVSPGLSLELSGEGRLYKCRDWRGIRGHVLENVKRWDGIPYVGVEVLNYDTK